MYALGARQRPCLASRPDATVSSSVSGPSPAVFRAWQQRQQQRQRQQRQQQQQQHAAPIRPSWVARASSQLRRDFDDESLSLADLKAQLDLAVEEEDYDLAARIRDALQCALLAAAAILPPPPLLAARASACLPGGAGCARACVYMATLLPLVLMRASAARQRRCPRPLRRNATAAF